ncbi:ribosomal RNA processing protein 1 homolog A-like isoform X2 [Dysidea avara]|uniref:ribosomal RNA processing protein 1 homolog A-like isoform X2 n=1 Tax=Dysidea avara TaxID=196820 RepID=UPI003316A2E5
MSGAEQSADSSAVMNFGRQLAASEKETRDKALRKVRKWLSSAPSAISENEMLKLWMGLYMTMWMADKPLIQEELASNLASLVQCFSDTDQVFLFIHSFFKTIRREWSNLDRLRMDKFYMLIRKMLRQTFEYLQQNGWEKSLLNHYLELMKQALNIPSTYVLADGITFHLVDVFLTELKKVLSTDQLSEDLIIKLVKPFCHHLAVTPDPSLREAITDSVFEPLAVAMETSTKRKFPFTLTNMSNEFLELAKDPNGARSSVNRKCLYRLRQRFANLSVVEVPSVRELKQDVADGGKLTKHKKRKSSHRQSIGEDRSGKRRKHSHINSEYSQEENSLENNETITPSVDILPTHNHDTENDILSECITKDMIVTPVSRDKVKKRRSLPATSTPRHTEEDDIPKKKCRSLVDHQDSLLFYSKPKAKEKKQTLPTVNPEDVLLLEESEPKPVKSSKIEVSVRETPKQVVKISPLATRSGKQVRRLSDLSPQPVKKSAGSKKLKLALQKNKSYAYQDTVNTTFDSSKQPTKSILKVSKPTPHLTRRKSSRFSKHS